MRVGFVGLGRMGAPMAANIRAAGHELTVWTRDSAKARDFAASHDARVAESPRDLAATTEAVVTMLADDAASTAVHLGDVGLLAAEGGAQHIIAMGTHAPDHLEHLRMVAAPRTLMDAPVSGSTKAATEAQLLIMAGATEAELAPVRPLLEAMGRRTVALGRPGAGSVMKLAVNALIHGLNQTVSEALNLATAAGIDIADAFDVVEASAAAAPMLSYRRALYLDDRAHDVTFGLTLAEKDMRLFADLCAEHRVAAPQAELNRQLLSDAARAGFGDADMAAMIRYMREKT